jgi:hypothetical protein
MTGGVQHATQGGCICPRVDGLRVKKLNEPWTPILYLLYLGIYNIIYKASVAETALDLDANGCQATFMLPSKIYYKIYYNNNNNMHRGQRATISAGCWTHLGMASRP